MAQTRNTANPCQKFTPLVSRAPLGLLKTEPPDRAPDRNAAPDGETVEKPVRRILCRECLHPITRERARTTINGAHQHTFANPSGIVFTIGCYLSADGCGAAGSPSSEFTWFKGFSWRVAVCAGCLSHLGWLFSSTGGAIFWGLILDHLIFPDNP